MNLKFAFLNYRLTKEMLQILAILAEIDYPAVESNLSEIMRKILQNAKDNPDDIQSIADFFNSAFKTSFSNRKVVI